MVLISRDQQESLDRALDAVAQLDRHALIGEWQKHYGRPPPAKFPRHLLLLGVGYKLQEAVFGGLKPQVRRRLQYLGANPDAALASRNSAPSPGTVLIREWRGKRHIVTVCEGGVTYQGQTHRSLTEVARLISGTHQSGPVFFGLRRGAA